MLEKTQKPSVTLRTAYKKVSENYETIVNTPHAYLQKDQQIIFGFITGVIGIFMMYNSVLFISTISMLTIIGVIGFLMSSVMLQGANKILTNAFV